MKAVGFLLQILIFGVVGFYTVNAQTPATETNPNNKSVSQTDNENERYRIGFQDTIEVSVYNHEKLSRKYSINPDGTIDLIRATKRIQAVCKTERELAKEIEADYLSFLRKPEVNVFAVEKKSQSYGVIGAVVKPANYYGERRVRLLDLLAMAGGPNDNAGSRMIVARTGSTSACNFENNETINGGEMVLMNFKIKDVMEAKQNIWMQPGDIVSVMDSDVVYVYGNVNRIGPVKMKEPITLTQAVVSAEGLKPTAKSQVRVLRQKKNSNEREEMIFDLKDIEKRKIQDPLLEPDDIVAVSEDSTKAVLRSITTIFKQGLPSIFYRF